MKCLRPFFLRTVSLLRRSMTALGLLVLLLLWIRFDVYSREAFAPGVCGALEGFAPLVGIVLQAAPSLIAPLWADTRAESERLAGLHMLPSLAVRDFGHTYRRKQHYIIIFHEYVCVLHMIIMMGGIQLVLNSCAGISYE